MAERFGVGVVEVVVREQNQVGLQREEARVDRNAPPIVRFDPLHAVRKIGVEQNHLAVRFKQQSRLTEPCDFHIPISSNPI